MLVVATEHGHIAVEGRREEGGLTSRARLVEDPADGGHESHVGHPVGLIEDDDADLAEVDRASLQKVLESTGGGHQHVYSMAQRLDLWAIADPAVDRLDSASDLTGQRSEILLDLLRELVGRRQHECMRPM